MYLGCKCSKIRKTKLQQLSYFDHLNNRTFEVYKNNKKIIKKVLNYSSDCFLWKKN